MIKKHEAIQLEFTSIDSSDVIATSAEVTTGGITTPWQKAHAAAPTPANFISDIEPINYNVKQTNIRSFRRTKSCDEFF